MIVIQIRKKSIERVLLKYLGLLSVQHWCQIKTNSSGATQPNRELWSLISYTHIRSILPHPLTVNVPWLIGSLGEIVYFWPQQVFCKPVYGRYILYCYCKFVYHSQLNSNPSGNRQLLGQTNVHTVSDFLTVCLFSKGQVRDNLNKFVYSTTRTRNIW